MAGIVVIVIFKIPSKKILFSVLADLLINLSAAWLVAGFVGLNLEEVALISASQILILGGDIMGSTLLLLISLELRALAGRRLYG